MNGKTYVVRVQGISQLCISHYILTYAYAVYRMAAGYSLWQ